MWKNIRIDTARVKETCYQSKFFISLNDVKTGNLMMELYPVNRIVILSNTFFLIIILSEKEIANGFNENFINIPNNIYIR